MGWHCDAILGYPDSYVEWVFKRNTEKCLQSQLNRITVIYMDSTPLSRQQEPTMSKITTENTYQEDLVEAESLMGQFVNAEQCNGNGRNWIDDALNDAWMDGMQITEWVAKAVTYIPAGFRRSAE